MKPKTTPFDASKYLKTTEDIVAFLEEAVEEGDPKFIAKALGVVAKAVGMTQIAKETGLSRESLYRSLSEEGNPEFATIIKVLTALNIKLKLAKPAPEPVHESCGRWATAFGAHSVVLGALEDQWRTYLSRPPQAPSRASSGLVVLRQTVEV